MLERAGLIATLVAAAAAIPYAVDHTAGSGSSGSRPSVPVAPSATSARAVPSASPSPAAGPAGPSSISAIVGDSSPVVPKVPAKAAAKASALAYDHPVALAAGRADNARNVPVTAVIHQAPPAGHVYWLVVTVYGVDPENPHTEYYGRRQLSSTPSTRPIRFTLGFPADSDSSLKRTAQVLSVSTAKASLLQKDTDSGGNAATVQQRVTTPCHDCDVSPSVTISFT